MIAAELAKALGGHRAGATWMARLLDDPAVAARSQHRALADPAARGPPPVHRHLPITTRHASADFDALTVGTVAKWTVQENETQSPTFVPWKSFPGRSVYAPGRFGERPPPDTGQSFERISDGRAAQ